MPSVEKKKHNIKTSNTPVLVLVVDSTTYHPPISVSKHDQYFDAKQKQRQTSKWWHVQGEQQITFVVGNLSTDMN